MHNYSYIARAESGALVRNQLMAGSPVALRSALEATGLQLVSWSMVATPWLASALSLPAPIDLGRWFKPSSRSIEEALRQLAIMLRSGLDLRSSLRTLVAQVAAPRLARSLNQVAQQVESGRSLASSLESTGDFPKIVVQLVGVGENSGTLSQVLHRAAEHMQQRRTILQSVQVALAYPAIVACASIAIALYLVVSVIPQLEKFLTAMGRHLPAMTQSLLDLSAWLRMYGATVFVAGGALVMALVALRRWPPARLWLDKWLLQVPVVGPVVQLAGTCTLASSLAVLQRSGVALVPALRVARQMQGNQHLARCVEQAEQSVISGGSLAEAFDVQPGPAPMLASMVGIAEKTGQLEASLEEVAQWSHSELTNRVKRLSLLLEPLIIVLAGGIVGYVYMAFFVALLSAGGAAR